MRPRAAGLSAGHVPVAPQPCALRGPGRARSLCRILGRVLVKDGLS